MTGRQKSDDRTLISARTTNNSMPSLMTIHPLDNSNRSNSSQYTDVTTDDVLASSNIMRDLLPPVQLMGDKNSSASSFEGKTLESLDPVFLRDYSNKQASRWETNDFERKPLQRSKSLGMCPSFPTRQLTLISETQGRSENALCNKSKKSDLTPSFPTRSGSSGEVQDAPDCAFSMGSNSERDSETNSGSQAFTQMFVAQEAVQYLMDSGAANSRQHALNLLDDLAADFKKNVVVKNRRYHLRTYKQCFIAEEAIDFLVDSGHALTRKGAVELGRALQRSQLFEHVCGDHAFKDGHFFFRFLNAKPTDELVEAFKQNMVIKDRKYRLKEFKQCFVAQEAVTWLTESGYALTREDAVEVGKSLQRSNLFDHVCGDHEFSDGYFFYRFLSEQEKVDGQNKFRILRSLQRRKLESVQTQLKDAVKTKDEETSNFHFPFTLEITPLRKEDSFLMGDDEKMEERPKRRKSLDTAPSMVRRVPSTSWMSELDPRSNKPRRSNSLDLAPSLVSRAPSPRRKSVGAFSGKKNPSGAEQFPCVDVREGLLTSLPKSRPKPKMNCKSSVESSLASDDPWDDMDPEDDADEGLGDDDEERMYAEYYKALLEE